MQRRKQVTDRILRRVHYATLEGTSLSTLAKVNNVDGKQLSKLLPVWREAHGLDGPVSSKEFMKAIHSVDTSEIDYCWTTKQQEKQAKYKASE